MRIWPNPTNSVLNIDFGSNFGKVKSYNIIDMSGVVVMSNESFNATSKELTINIEKLKNGIYLLMSDDQKVITRFIKE